MVYIHIVEWYTVHTTSNVRSMLQISNSKIHFWRIVCVARWGVFNISFFNANSKWQLLLALRRTESNRRWLLRQFNRRAHFFQTDMELYGMRSPRWCWWQITIFSCFIFIYFRTYWLVRHRPIFRDEYNSWKRDYNFGNIFCILTCVQKCLVCGSFSFYILDAFQLADPTREFCTVAMFSFVTDWSTSYRIFTFCSTSSCTQSVSRIIYP